MDIKHVLILFGGRSSEHEVSLSSAKNVVEAIDKNKYTVSMVTISRAGKWQKVDNVREANDDDTPVVVDLNEGIFVAGDEKIKPDVVFPVLHGKYGEDGTLQGMLDLMGMSYVGCGVEASAICMDKIRTKRLLAAVGIPVVRDRIATNLNFNVADLPGPWFVKPSRAGSSVGVTKVKDANLLAVAVESALAHDSEVLIEMAVQHPRELEVAVMGNMPNVITSAVGEIIPGEEFYNYDDKYTATSTSQVIEKADLPNELNDTIRDIAEQAYDVLNCRGLARVDFLLSGNGELYVNEVNTMPGFTNSSMFPKLMMKAGYSYPQLIDKLIELALQ